MAVIACFADNPFRHRHIFHDLTFMWMHTRSITVVTNNLEFLTVFLDCGRMQETLGEHANLQKGHKAGPTNNLLAMTQQR